LKILLVLLLLVPATAFAAETTCRKSTALTGICTTVKGSLGMTQGIGVTLNTEDGRRILIKAPPDSNMDIATPVMQNWLYWQSKTNSMRTRINGSFQLCPLPAQPNPAAITDFGCIQARSRITEDKSAAAGN
jgi:hypothetical protein